MSQAETSLPRTWEQTDVAHVVRALRSTGPLPLADIDELPDLDAWPPERIRAAVVTAWSQDLISIDPRDLLVVL